MLTRMCTVAAMAALSIAALGCATTGPSIDTDPGPSAAPGQVSDSPVVEPSPSVRAARSAPSASARLVVSERHGYRMEVPVGWVVSEYDGTWTTFEEFGLGVEVPGEDVIDSPGLGAFLVLNSMAIPDGLTDAAWRQAFDEVVTAALPPDCPGTPSERTFAGEPAIVLEQSCGGSEIVGRSFTHAGRGYYITTVAPEGGAAGPILGGMLASLTFLD